MTTSCVAVPTKKEGSQEIIIQRLEQASTHKNGKHPDHCFKQIKLCASNLVSKFFKSDEFPQKDHNDLDLIKLLAVLLICYFKLELIIKRS